MAKEMFIENSVVIKKTQQELFDYLKIISNQNNFSVWNMADPNQQTKKEGTDGTVGFIYSWDSKVKRVGAGSQEIKALNEPATIDCELRFLRPMKNVAATQLIIDKTSDSESKVTWTFRGPTKFPMSLFTGMIKKMLNKDMSKSLENLKTVLEK